MQQEEQMYFEKQNPSLRRIQELTRLKVLTAKSLLSKRYQAISLSHHNLLSCMEMMIQTFSLVTLAHQEKLKLKISKRVFREKVSGNVFVYYELIEKGQNFINKFEDELTVYTEERQSVELLKLNISHYDNLYHLFKETDCDVAQFYNTLARYFHENQEQIMQGSIDERQILAYLQRSPIFLQFSLNQRLFNTLIAFSINDSQSNKHFLHAFAEKKQIEKKDNLDLSDSNNSFILKFKKQLTSMFTLFALNQIVSLEDTVDQNEEVKKKKVQMDTNTENNEFNYFRSKYNEWNLINFSIRINQRHFAKKSCKKSSLESSEEQMCPINVFSSQRGKSSLLFKVKISFETYLYKERNDCWILSTCLRMPIMMKSLDFLEASSVWAQLMQNPCFNYNNRNIFLEEDPKSHQIFLSQRFKIEDFHKVDLLSEIVNRSDELIIIYLCFEPALMHFSRKSLSEGPRNQEEIEHQKMAYLSDDELDKIARKTAKAVNLYNNMLRAKELTRFTIISESIRSYSGAL